MAVGSPPWAMTWGRGWGPWFRTTHVVTHRPIEVRALLPYRELDQTVFLFVEHAKLQAALPRTRRRNRRTETRSLVAGLA